MTLSAPPRAERWLAPGLALAVFAVYCGTLAPGLTGGDSGELICAAADLGVAHPPGYPLWTMLGHGFTWLPFGSVAWRLNLFSAVCGAAAVGVLCHVIRCWTKQAWAGVLGAGLFAFSPLAWEYARQAEVFALNNLLLAVVLLAATRFNTAPKAGNAFGCALVSGLALVHHHTAIFIVGPIAVWVAWKLLTLKIGRVHNLAAASAGAVLGLLPYAYLPLAAHFSSGWSWGECDTWSGFLTHFLRREYGTFQLASGDVAKTVSLPRLLAHYFGHAFKGLGVIGLPLAMWGMGALCIRRSLADVRTLAWMIGLGLGMYLLVFLSLANLSPDDPLLAGVLERFWMLPDLVLALFGGVGCATIFNGTGRAQRFGKIGIVVALVGSALWHGSRLPSHSRVIADYGRTILQPLPTNAVLLVRGDLVVNAVRYVNTCEQFRADVSVVDLELLTRAWQVRQMQRRFPQLNFPARIYHPTDPIGFSFAQFVAANRQGQSIWIYPEPKPGDPTVAGFSFWPRGLPQEVRPKDSPLAIESWREANRAQLDAAGNLLARASTNAPGSWERVAAQDYWTAEHRHALALLQIAFDAPGNGPALHQSRAAYEDFLARCPENAWYAWKNVGLIYEREAATDAKAREREAAAFHAYLRLAPANDPDRAAIAAFLKATAK